MAAPDLWRPERCHRSGGLIALRGDGRGSLRGILRRDPTALAGRTGDWDEISMGKSRPRDLPPSRRPGGRADRPLDRAAAPSAGPSKIPAASEISVKMQQIADQIDHLPDRAGQGRQRARSTTAPSRARRGPRWWTWACCTASPGRRPRPTSSRSTPTPTPTGRRAWWCGWTVGTASSILNLTRDRAMLPGEPTERGGGEVAGVVWAEGVTASRSAITRHRESAGRGLRFALAPGPISSNETGRGGGASGGVARRLQPLEGTSNHGSSRIPPRGRRGRAGLVVADGQRPCGLGDAGRASAGRADRLGVVWQGGPAPPRSRSSRSRSCRCATWTRRCSRRRATSWRRGRSRRRCRGSTAIIARCSPRRTSTSSWSPRPTTGTPWPAIAAMEAGADLYCQKPISVDVAEGQAMLAAARKLKRVVQVGTQRRSTPHLIEAKEKVVEAGLLGKIGLVEICCYYHMRGRGNPPDMAPPASLDWESWIGPAPFRPYNTMIHPRGWRSFKEFGNGIVGDMCIHMLDMTRWMMGLGWPKSDQLQRRHPGGQGRARPTSPTRRRRRSTSATPRSSGPTGPGAPRPTRSTPGRADVLRRQGDA